jgi:hypothetical protein
LFRTSLGTSTASGTFFFVYLGDAGFRIYADSTEVADIYAVSAAKTSERAGCLSLIKG